MKLIFVFMKMYECKEQKIYFIQCTASYRKIYFPQEEMKINNKTYLFRRKSTFSISLGSIYLVLCQSISHCIKNIPQVKVLRVIP